MKIAIFGATGNIGKVIAQEALSRGHSVTGLVRRPERGEADKLNLSFRQADVLNADHVAVAVAGHDVVVSAYAPDFSAPETLIVAANALLKGLQTAKVKRLLIVGGAGSLEVQPGLQLLDTPQFPPDWRPLASAHGEALKVYRQNTALDWTYFSPAAMIASGERTGAFRLGDDNRLLTDAQGNSSISIEDFSIALVNEIETPRYIHKRVTVAY
ncbi:MAG: NAD(P)-dependent oxidoreductase [Anaerolineales bacterium]|nr:NAD(P)-dependent oxidoreductase [Anaerolineales bacterium]MCZ2122164.1 NAD(P)-dependent oxidoreductase [Anaerolineales bacterium]